MENARINVLVAGWFSFESGHATAGDILARDLVRDWLRDAGFPCDVAVDAPFTGGVDWRQVSPADYSHVVFVCGPFQKRAMEEEFLQYFERCKLIGVDLSMLVRLDQWSPFDVLFERDSSVTARPDIVFLSRPQPVPVVGRCLVEPYEPSHWRRATDAIDRALASRDVAVVDIDTRLDTNATRLRTPREIESVIARMDVVITTRLHGLVLALKNGVPVVAVDPMGDGAKILRQAQTIGWPWVFAADTVTDAELLKAFDAALTKDANAMAAECTERARRLLELIPEQFIEAVRSTASQAGARSSRVPRSSSRPTVDTSSSGEVVSTTPPASTTSDERPAVGQVQFGGLRRLSPISRDYGFDRGLPIDRYYIENFLASHSGDVRGRVLEIGDDTYTRRFGADRVTRRDVLHVWAEHPAATIVGDLTTATHIESNAFDCVILTQTLQLIYDVGAALATVHRILRPGGVLLATFPGLSQIADHNWRNTWYWGFTTASTRRLFEAAFPGSDVTVNHCGNVLTTTAFLHGLATGELQPLELDYHDPDYELLLMVRAVKA